MKSAGGILCIHEGIGGVRFYTVVNYVSFCTPLCCLAEIHRNHLDGPQIVRKEPMVAGSARRRKH
jgi:hypothetical protein